MKFGAGILAISEKNGIFRLLVAKRSKNLTFPGEWAIIGGGSRGKERPLETAKREFKEETQYEGGFSGIKLLKTQQKGSKNPLYYVYLCKIDHFLPVLDHENDEIRWLELEEMMKIEPKHFGLRQLLSDKTSMKEIQRYLSDDK